MSHDGRALSEGSPPSAATSSTPPSPITLNVPRPENQRSVNVYVDTPFKHKVSSRRPSPHLPIRGDLPLVHGSPSRSSQTKRSLPPGSPQAKVSPASYILTTDSDVAPVATSTFTTVKTPTLQQKTRTSPTTPSTSGAIVKQPTSLSFSKPWNSDGSENSSIICVWCGRCRCEACTTPRPLPAKWLFGNRWLCSSMTTVDLLSCLCIVKGVLYHCGHEHESGVSDKPCTCAGPDKCLRWTCLVAAAVPLPCLVCYWPLNYLRRFVEKTYQKCTSHGCTCSDPNRQSQPPTPPQRPSCRSVPEGKLLGAQTFFKL